MAAVTGGLLEAQTTRLDPSDETLQAQARQRAKALGSFGDLGAALRALPSVPQSHASLTRTVWIRRTLEQWAARNTFRVVQADEGANAGQLVFRLDGPPMPKTVVPWMTATDDWQEFALWGESGKMACPTWDLPAGGLTVGGTCPGADAGQTIVDPALRRQRLDFDSSGRAILKGRKPEGDRAEMKEGGTICSQCYAFEGNYPSPHVQLGEVLRYWWLRSMLQQDRLEELVETLVLSMRLIRYPKTPYGIYPVRIHSAGDFFSQDYARAWLRVADELWRLNEESRRVVMWAPTRTWASGNWTNFWKGELPRLRSVRDGRRPNLMVRASAYNFNDTAPEAFVPGNARGSTSLFQTADARRLELPRTGAERFYAPPGEMRYEWACPTYAIEQEKHTCANATSPEGHPHCRACWVHPEMRIHYTAH